MGLHQVIDVHIPQKGEVLNQKREKRRPGASLIPFLVFREQSLTFRLQSVLTADRKALP